MSAFFAPVLGFLLSGIITLSAQVPATNPPTFAEVISYIIAIGGLITVITAWRKGTAGTYQKLVEEMRQQIILSNDNATTLNKKIDELRQRDYERSLEIIALKQELEHERLLREQAERSVVSLRKRVRTLEKENETLHAILRKNEGSGGLPNGGPDDEAL